MGRPLPVSMPGAAAGRDALLLPGLLLGAGLIGWGGFNVIEGVINHHLLELHHVRQAAAEHAPADLAVLASGVLLVLAGVWLRRKRR